MNALRPAAAALLFLCVACGPMETAEGPDDALGTSTWALSLKADEAAAIFAVVNYPGTTVAVLDEKAGLDRRAASNIIARRDGADGLALSADDRPFTSIAELDAVPYVGDTAFTRLLTWARTWPAPGGETVEGIAFAGWESQAVVYGVNHIVPDLLDGMLDARAASGLVASRPFISVAQMGPIAYVGPTALARLRQEAPLFWGAMQNPNAPQPPPPAPAQHAGTFDGVAFDEATAVTAIALCNQSTRDALVAGGIPAAPAAAIVGNRPYATLDQVAAVGGVGTATMQALQRLAAAGQVDPLAALRTQLEQLTDGLWLTSETDARFFFVSAAGIGTAPITEQLIREKLGAQHDALIAQVMYVPPDLAPLSTRVEYEVIDGATFFNRIIDNADPNDPASLEQAQRYVKLRDALTSQLSGLEVHRFGRINISTFILGRTADGALAGLLTGQVET